MRARTTAALVALGLADVLVLVLGYRAHSGSLPPLQRASTTFEVRGTPTSEPVEAPGKPEITAPLLLAVSPAGDVLRATRGACEDFRERSAQVWVGSVNADTPPATVQVPGIREVLGLMVYGDGTMRIAGLDENCEAVTLESTGGDDWQPSDVVDMWRLSPDTTASNVTGPRGSEIPTTCAPSQILNLPAKRGIASCSTGTFFTLVPGKQATSLAADNFTQLAVAPGAEGRFFAFGATADCGARVAVVQALDQSVTNLACFGGNRAPLAIASTRDLLVVQVGEDLMVSRDDGESFESVGPESGTPSSAS